MSTPTPDEQALTEQIAEAVRPILRRRALMSDVDLPAYIARALLPVMKTAQRDALTGLADHIDWTASQFLGIRVGSQKAQDVRDYRDAHYPEETR